MARQQQTAHGVGARRRQLSAEERRERQQRVLAQGMPSITQSIVDAVVVKEEDLFFLSEPDGSVPLADEHGFGLYYHDCRYLNSYQLLLAGTRPNVLASTAPHGFMAIFQLTNQDIRKANGQLIPKDQLGIKWVHVIDSTRPGLHDLLTFTNFGLREVEFPISLTFDAMFEDIFAVRGLLPERLGKRRPPCWQDGALSFVYDGADGLYRTLAVHFSPQPQKRDGTTAHFRIALQPRESKQVMLSLSIGESPNVSQVQPQAPYRHPDFQGIERVARRSADEWIERQTDVQTDSLLVNRIVDRSLRDLRVLKSCLENHDSFAAGVPWFTTLFGRDSLITSLQTLAYDPRIAEQTLRVLARYQGGRVDDWRDEQPGKILHELRVGEMTRTGEIPYGPYYGTIDATPLFLILVAQHAAWTGSLAVFNDLRSHVELALEWMKKYGDSNGAGYLEYQGTSEKGLINQGWKDSGDAIVNDDGSLAKPPISLVEVQGYAYLARLSLADLYDRAGASDRATQLRQEARDLRTRFNRDFWLDDKGFYALALQAANKPAAVLTSNPGQALWTGIADPDKARLTMERLTAADMFNGWGIRTLSQNELRYNPIGYHLGTVWPHDNSIIAAGFRRYGFDEAAHCIFAGIAEAAMHFPRYRLPGLFAGFRREDYVTPVHYPVACHPQAWAAGAVPFLVTISLGLIPEAFERRLRVVRPALPDFIRRVQIRRLRVGNAQADLSFERTMQGTVAINVLNVDGHLDIVMEPRT